MAVLESIEWTNFWWPNTENDVLPRVLMVGDSISVGYRETVNKYLAGYAVASTISTSKAVDNPYFISEIEYAISQNGWKYELVHFNNGLHGFHLSTSDYAIEYANALDELRAKHSDIKFILALSTPITMAGANAYDVEKNAVVNARNAAVIKIAGERNLPVDDLNAVVLDRPQLRAGDGYHYNADGYDALGRAVAQAVIAELGR